MWRLQRAHIVGLLYRGALIGIRLVLFVWRHCELLWVVGLIIEAAVKERAIDSVLVYESCGGMIAWWSTAGHSLEVSDSDLRTNSSLVCIGALGAAWPSTCFLWLIVDLCSESSLCRFLLFPQVLLSELSYFRVIWEFGSMGCSFVHTDRSEGLASAYWWGLWPIWTTTRVRILAAERLTWIVRKVALITRIRPTTFVFLTISISLIIIDFTAVNAGRVLLLRLLFTGLTDASVTLCSLNYNVISVGPMACRRMSNAFSHMLGSMLLEITTVIVLSFVVEGF